MAKLHVGIFRTRNYGPNGATKCVMAMAEHWAQRFDVTLFSTKPVNWRHLQQFFGVDLNGVNLVELQPLPTYYRRLLLAIPQQDKWLERVATQTCYARQIRARQLDLFVNHSPDLTMPPLAKRSLYMCTFPNMIPQTASNPDQSPRMHDLVDKSRTWLRWIPAHPGSLNRLRAYDIIAANSRFTQGWIQQRWGLSSTVVYAACELVDGTQPKTKVICHAGRFTSAHNSQVMNKHQELMIETFKALPDLHHAGWQLHLAGGYHPTPENAAQLAALQRAAEGYPIIFHVNAGLAELHQLYRTARLYWHATGYGQDAQRYPETQEHFGMTIVEAMSAGAVPVVFNSGGPTETVTHGVNGFVWDDLSELAACTRRLAADESLRSTLSQQAIVRSQHFSKANFLARLDTIVDHLLADQL
jgi:glycosyltransferase involved in cell wall biosynthesis